MEINLKEYVKEADMVLVGIGYEFSADRQGTDKDTGLNRITDDIERQPGTEWMIPYVTAYCNQHNPDKAVREAYNQLKRLLEGKNYFIISLNQDGLIEKTELDQERIVTPCGNVRFVQCEENCEGKLWESGNIAEDIYKGCIKKPGHLDTIEKPCCPACQKGLVFNNVHANQYNEDGYLKQWDLYTKWLQGTLNRKLCILELGVGMEYPSVIRWPFEKIAYFNQKSQFIRIHQKLFQMSEELRGKGISIAENARDCLMGQSLT